QTVHRHSQIWKVAHEAARNFRNGRSTNLWLAVVHTKRAILREERRDVFRIMTAPRFRVTPRKLCHVVTRHPYYRSDVINGILKCVQCRIDLGGVETDKAQC